MDGGVSTQSQVAEATISAVSGSWSSDYPLSNALDLRRPSKVARAAGSVSFDVVLPAAQSLGVAALVNHTLPSGSIRVRLYAGAAASGSPAADSGVVDIWPEDAAPVANCRWVRPVFFSAVSARTARFDITAPGAFDLGGIELSPWWAFPIGPGKEFGVMPVGQRDSLVGGAAEIFGAARPRGFNGQIPYIPMSVAERTGVDFQRWAGKTQPFVFVQDMEDVEGWARTNMLAVNQELPPGVGALYRHDRFQFRFREHLR